MPSFVRRIFIISHDGISSTCSLTKRISKLQSEMRFSNYILNLDITTSRP